MRGFPDRAPPDTLVWSASAHGTGFGGRAVFRFVGSDDDIERDLLKRRDFSFARISAALELFVHQPVEPFLVGKQAGMPRGDKSAYADK